MVFNRIASFMHGIVKLVYMPFRLTSYDFSWIPSLQTSVIFLWTLIVGYFRKELSTIGLEYINAAILVITLMCITWTEYLITSIRIDRLLDRRYVQELVSAMVYLSFPVVLVFYVWYPLYEHVPCMLKRFTKEASGIDEWKSTTWVFIGLGLFLSAVYGVVRELMEPVKNNPTVVYKKELSHVPVTRSMTHEKKHYYKNKM